MTESPHGKYHHSHGLYSSESLIMGDATIDMPEDLKEYVIKNANASASYQTWRSVKSVDRRIRECAADLKVDMSFPWNAGQVTTFTAWCLRRNLREKSIQNYLSKVNSSTQSNLTSELFSFLGEETP